MIAGPLLRRSRTKARTLLTSASVGPSMLRNSLSRRFGAAPPLPPKPLRFMGEDDATFLKIGDDLVAELRAYAGLQATSRVLDIGSGYGRCAHALLRWPEFVGQYQGFDILKRHVEWCRLNLSQLHRPSLHFLHLDVQNDRYNAGGKLRSENLIFPVAPESVDVVLLASVFTHMYPREVLRYLSEIARVLSPGGRAFASLFLYGIEGFEGVRTGTAYPMLHTLNAHSKTARLDDPLFAIGYQWSWLSERISELGLRVSGPPLLGSWAGERPEAGCWQDFLVLERQ